MNQNYIDGRWVDARSERRYPVADLQNADRVLAEYPVSDERDAVAAIASGRRGFEEWKRTAYRDRVDIVASLTRSLEASADTLRTTLVQATGKTKSEAQAELESTLWFMRELPGVGSDFEGAMPPFPKLEVRFRGPLGLCVLQAGSLYPLFDLVCFTAAAFMWGNTSVLLPGPSAAAVAKALADMVHEAPHVPGTFHLLHGATPKLTQLLRDHPDVARFVSGQDGSFHVGKDLKPSETAQAAALILDDADLTRATGAVVRGALLANGQHPKSLHRIVVHRRIVNEFQSRLSETVRALRVGDPLDPTVEVGPLLTPGRVKETQKHVQKAVKEGAQILCGGSAPSGELKRGSFFEPTVLASVSPSMEVCGASLGGPVLSLITVDSFEEGIHVLNDGPLIPAASLFTRSMERTHRTLRELSASSISVNQPPTVGGNPKDCLDSLTLTKHIALG